jgi:hypothetical protein
MKILAIIGLKGWLLISFSSLIVFLLLLRHYLRKVQVMSGTIKDIKIGTEDYNDVIIETDTGKHKISIYKRGLYKVGDYVYLEKKRGECVYEFTSLRGVH